MPRQLAIAAASAAAALLALAAPAQAYPDRPITMVVPWGAGGGTDTLARTFSALLEEELGQPVNVVNRTGAGGVVGHSAIVTAEPDGYTLGIGTVELTGYEPLGQSDMTPASFTMLCRLASLPGSVTVRADSPHEDASALLEAIKAEPEGAYTSSGSGVGGAWHLAVAGWLNSEGVDPLKVRFVPSKGGAPALQDLVAGGINLFTGAPAEAKPLADAGQVKILAIMSPERIDPFPDTPTLGEATGTDWDYATWFGFVGPDGLPEDVRTSLIEAATNVFESEEFGYVHGEPRLHPRRRVRRGVRHVRGGRRDRRRRGHREARPRAVGAPARLASAGRADRYAREGP
ncbi:tripartite tricarboxylate transporter substrate binding protein [Acuticoccus sp.]|uniref:tripartite tricarboxylate transporter substrate binding protein n=1 Tax=Acuticoccus sp. TaxID=1904378 RepID=UPI003B529D69